MFKKALVAGCIFATCTSVAFAGNGRRYKDQAPQFKDAAPCNTYQFTAGPYVGLSASPRVVYNSNPIVYKGLQGILSIGYGALLTPLFYLGLEGYGGNNFQLKDYPNGIESLRVTWSYGLNLIPGIMLTDYLLTYLRAGAERLRFSDQHSYGTGWQIGFGGQTNIVPNWDFRVEYLYTWFTDNVRSVNQPYSDQFNVGVVYRFN